MIRIILNRTIVRPALVTAFALVSALSAHGQTSQTDSQTLQAILAELRGIHNDVRLTAVSQILLTELQTRQTVVNQASERVSKARLQVSNLQAEEKRTAAELAHAEDRVGENSRSQRKGSDKRRDRSYKVGRGRPERQRRRTQRNLAGGRGRVAFSAGYAGRNSKGSERNGQKTPPRR